MEDGLVVFSVEGLNPLQEVGVMKCWLREALLLLTCLLLLRTATTTGPPKDWRRGYFTRFPLKNQ